LLPWVSQLPPLFGAQGVHAAGLIVGGSLVRLHWMGLFCGVVFLLVMLLGRAPYLALFPQVRCWPCLMMLLTAYSQFSSSPVLDTAAATHPRQCGRQWLPIIPDARSSIVCTEPHACGGLVLLCGIARPGGHAHSVERYRSDYPPVLPQGLRIVIKISGRVNIVWLDRRVPMKLDHCLPQVGKTSLFKILTKAKVETPASL